MQSSSAPRHAVQLSKFLSLHLRHRPEALGLTLAEGGWVTVDSLLAATTRHGQPITRAELAAVVMGNDKQRFAFDATGTLIRAQQGHSIAVDLQLRPALPPAVLYHGTHEQALAAIRQTGLQKMKRHHVHLSPDEETARRVGRRRGAPIILSIDAGAMYAAGILFYQSGNGVWLTDEVPPKFVREP